MKRLQIYLPIEMDAALEARATEQGTSKAALIRQYVAGRLTPSEKDGLDDLVGAYDEEPGSIDDLVYGR